MNKTFKRILISSFKIVKAIIEPVNIDGDKIKPKPKQGFKNFKFNYNKRLDINLSDTQKIKASMVAVVGETGSGKTQLIKKIIRSGVQNNVKFFIIDNKTDYIDKNGNHPDAFATDNSFEVCNILDSTIGFNPLVKNKKETNIIIAYKFISIVKNLYPLLGGIQKTNLKNTLVDYLSTCEIDSLIPSINGMMEFFYENELTGAYMELLEPLVDFNIFTNENISFADWVSNLKTGYILDTKSMYTIDNKVFMFVSYTFLEFLTRDVLNGDASSINGDFKQINNCLVIDEASDLMERRSGALDDLLKKAREVGFGVVFGTQTRSQFKTQTGSYNYFERFVLTFVGSTEKEQLSRDCFRINIFGDEVFKNIPYYKTKEKK